MAWKSRLVKSRGMCIYEFLVTGACIHLAILKKRNNMWRFCLHYTNCIRVSSCCICILFCYFIFLSVACNANLIQRQTRTIVYLAICNYSFLFYMLCFTNPRVNSVELAYKWNNITTVQQLCKMSYWLVWRIPSPQTSAFRGRHVGVQNSISSNQLLVRQSNPNLYCLRRRSICFRYSIYMLIVCMCCSYMYICKTYWHRFAGKLGHCKTVVVSIR